MLGPLYYGQESERLAAWRSWHGTKRVPSCVHRWCSRPMSADSEAAVTAAPRPVSPHVHNRYESWTYPGLGWPPRAAVERQDYVPVIVSSSVI